MTERRSEAVAGRVGKTCHDLEWLNSVVHPECIRILDRVSNETGEDPHLVAVMVGQNLLWQAASMIAVASGVQDLAVPLGKKLYDLVIAELQASEAGSCALPGR